MGKILIVDDQSLVASYLERTLKGLGYNVVGKAFSGEEAVQTCDIYDPDVILMDIVMPGSIDGITAAEIIKKRKNIPVVFLTAFPDDQNITRAAKTFASGFLIKPVNKRSIKAAVEIALCTQQPDVYHGAGSSFDEHTSVPDIESQHLVQAFLNFTDYAVILVDEMGIIRLNNRISGTLLKQISGKIPEKGIHLSEYLPSEYISLFDASYQKALAGEQVYVERYFNGPGLWLAVRYIPIKIQENFVRFVLVTARNITEENKLALSLKRYKAQYSATINSMFDPMFIVDRELRIEYCNDSFRRWLDFFEKNCEIIPSHISDVLPFLDKNVLNDYKDVLESGEPSILKKQWVIRGTCFYYEMVKIPVPENGITAKVITLIRDLTDIREMEYTIQSMLFRQLTKKECEVMKYIAGGLSRKEVAKEMHIACATYDKHLQNIKKKLNISRHSELPGIADCLFKEK